MKNYLINSCLFRTVSTINFILLEDRKNIWSRFRLECWSIEKKKNAFNYYSSYEDNCKSNNIKNASLKLNAESSIIVASNVIIKL